MKFDLAKWRALYRKDLPAPVDVLNLIHLRDWSSYRWYAVTVSPLLALAGGKPQWMGRLAREIHGPKQADKLLVVRYANQRAFLWMVSNPYYLLVNKLRERGVASFEAAFTHSPEHATPLRRHKRFLIVHFNARDAGAALAGVKKVFEDSAASFVYSSSEQSAIDLVDEYAPTDPNPLSFKQVAFFAVPTGADVEEIATAEVIKRLAEATGDFALHLYEADDPRNYVRVFSRD